MTDAIRVAQHGRELPSIELIAYHVSYISRP